MVKKRHILFIVENCTVPWDKRVWGEAKAAKEFGFEVSVICPDDKEKSGSANCIDGIPIYRHPLPKGGYSKWGIIYEYVIALLWELILSIRIYIKKPFHFIHAANPPDHVFLIALLFKLLGVKFIFDHHDLTPETYFAKFGKKDVIYSVLMILERLTFLTSDIVISTNNSYRDIALGRGMKKDEEVFVVRNGPDLSAIPYPIQANPRYRAHFKYLVGYVGIIGQQEGIDNLIEAIDYIVKERKRTDIRFIVIGTGPYWDEVVRLSREKGVDNYLWFTGFIPYEDFFEILATVDICVNPEFANEFTDKSTMVKIMDYMTFGKPIVQFLTKEGQVTAGEASVYVESNSIADFAQCVLKLLANPSQMQIMGREGRKRIEEQLCWQIQKSNLKEAYSYLQMNTK